MKKDKLLLIATVVAMSFASCSDDVTGGENSLESTLPSKSKVKVVNDQNELSQYVTNYKTGTFTTRAMPGIPEQNYQAEAMPTLPSSLDGMTKVEVPSWKWGGLDGNTDFYVASGEEQDFTGGGLNANNVCNLYIYGKLILPSFAPAQGANIYVAPGGELIINGVNWNGEPNGVLTDDKPTNLYIYNGGVYKGSYTSASKTGLYVEGDLTTENVTFGGKVVIGGKVIANNLATNNADFKAESVEAATWTYYNDSKVNVKELIEIKGNVEINAQNVAIKCKNYSVGGNFHMENNSELYAYEHLGVNGYFENSSQGLVYTPCLYVEEQLYMKNSGTLAIPNYIYCGSFKADASGFNIQMGEKALFLSNSTFTIENKNWTIEFNNTAETTSAIVAKKFEIMEGEAAYIYGHAVLSAGEYWGKPSESTQYYVDGENYKNYNLQETVQLTFNGVTVTSDPTDCTPEFTVPGGTKPEPPTITELISTIAHTHDISATCVAIYNGKGYLSWHKRGTSIHGCLEALKVENDKTVLTSWMEVDDDDVEGGNNWDGNSAVEGTEEEQGQFDYNHIIVADGKVVTVGDHAKMSGFIGAIDLDSIGDFGTNGTVQEFFKYRQLLGSYDDPIGRSGNAVLYDGKKYYIACAAGFQEYTGKLDDIFVKENGKWKAKLGAYELTNGSAKHIAINPAGDKVATLELTAKGEDHSDDYWFNDTETEIEAVLKVRPAATWLSNTEWSVNIGNIAPIYGKNAIAMDASGNVYVSAGKQGLLVYNNGNKVGEFSIAKECPKAGANGVAIDDKYVYLAYGVGGLYILNKSDLSVVSWYKSNAPVGYTTQAAAAAANYVALDGKYIYVAYGRHGVKVLKLNDKKQIIRH